jgi:hypothetical protein
MSPVIMEKITLSKREIREADTRRGAKKPVKPSIGIHL